MARLVSTPILLTSTLAVAFLCGGPASAAPPRAESEGKPGRVVRITINAQGSNDYASFHGMVTIRRPGSNQSVEYRWGGSTCPAQKLSDAHVALLTSALHNRHKTLVAPRYIEGEGSKNRCLVAFDLVAGS